jgi:hypothetical protein
MGPYFRSAKGIHQGDPLSPGLFNIALEVKMVLKAQRNWLLVGLAADLIPSGIAFYSMWMIPSFVSLMTNDKAI